MDMQEKTRENRLRRIAERRGLRLEKSRRRDPHAIDFGGYMLIDTYRNTVVEGGNPHAYSATLDDIENHFGKIEKDGKGLGGQIRKAAAMDATWTPLLDEAGEPITVKYFFGVSDANENSIHDEETAEKQPMSDEALRHNAKLVARTATKNNPQHRPWIGWTVSVCASGLHDEPEQVVMYRVEELL